MKKSAKKTYSCPVIMVIDLPCEVLLIGSNINIDPINIDPINIDPYADKETIDIPLDDFQTDPDEGTFDAL